MGCGAGAAPRQAAEQGQGTARLRRLRQPLRGCLRRRARPDLGGRALRIAGVRAYGGVFVSGDRAGRPVGSARARGGGHLRPGRTRGPRLLGADEAGGALRVRGAGVGGAEGGRDRRRARGRTRPQPPQLRVGGGALRAHLRGGAQGGDAGVPGTEGVRGRVNGRRRCDPGGDGRRDG